MATEEVGFGSSLGKDSRREKYVERRDFPQGRQVRTTRLGGVSGTERIEHARTVCFPLSRKLSCQVLFIKVCFAAVFPLCFEFSLH